jgi:hypothetical protein
MTIRFKCPNAACKKILVVKDELAGKRAKCPACKQSVSIPAPISAPADLEAFAAAAFAGEPAAPKAAAAAKPAETRTIDFTCSYCDAELHLPADQGGKQVPCPECSRIIKVPQLKVEKAKDWRDVEKKGPSFVKQDAPEKPAGAWDTGTSKVSQDALEEAGVITEPEEPRTLKERLKWPLIGVGAVALVAVLWIVSSNLMSKSAQKQALDAALAYVDVKGGKAKLAPTLGAAIYRGAGEFQLRARQAEEAKRAYANARGLCMQNQSDKATALDRDCELAEMAVQQVGLGGTGEDVRGTSSQRERMEWEEVHPEIEATLRAIVGDEARAAAVREVARKLIEADSKDGKAAALGLAKSLSTTDIAAEADAGKESRPKVLAQYVALGLAVGHKDKEAEDKLPERLKNLMQAEVKALTGDFREARKFATKDKGSAERLEASLAVAAVALGKGETNEAKASVEDALGAQGELKKANKKIDSFQAVQLSRLAARVGLTDKAKDVADGITDKDKTARARAHLELLRAKLAELAQGGTAADLKMPDEFIKDKDTLAYALAHEAVARHNTRLGQRAAVLETVETLEERLRPFVQIGVALGLQDKQK